MRKALLIMAALLCVGTALVYASPATTYVVRGRVVDSKDEPVPAARIFIQSADGTAPRAFRADAKGKFSRVVSRTGLYDMRAEAGGLWSEWLHNVSAKSSARSEIVLKLVRTDPPDPLP